MRLQPLGHLSRDESAAALCVGGKLLQESLDRQPKYGAIESLLILWPEPLKPQGADGKLMWKNCRAEKADSSRIPGFPNEVSVKVPDRNDR